VWQRDDVSTISLLSIRKFAIALASDKPGTLQSIINIISTNISHVQSGAVSQGALQSVDARVTSVFLVAANAGASAAQALSILSTVSSNGINGIQSALNELSDQIAAIPGGGSVSPVAVVGTTALYSTSTGAQMASLTVSVSAGGVYEVNLVLIAQRGTATHSPRFGISVATGKLQHGRVQVDTMFNLNGSRSAVMLDTERLNGTSNTTLGAGGNNVSGWINAKGAIKVSTTSKLVPHLGEMGGNNIIVMPGSFFKVLKLN
jgi:hypothetical protein